MSAEANRRVALCVLVLRLRLARLHTQRPYARTGKRQAGARVRPRVGPHGKTGARTDAGAIGLPQVPISGAGATAIGAPAGSVGAPAL